MLKRESDLSEWQQLSDDWEQSGLNQKEYCKRKGISRSSFSQSRSKLLEQGLAKRCDKHSKSVENLEEMRFVPVHLPMDEALPEQADAAVGSANFIEINLPHGIVMRIPT